MAGRDGVRPCAHETYRHEHIPAYIQNVTQHGSCMAYESHTAPADVPSVLTGTGATTSIFLSLALFPVVSDLGVCERGCVGVCVTCFADARIFRHICRCVIVCVCVSVEEQLS